MRTAPDFSVDVLDLTTDKVRRCPTYVGWNEWAPKTFRETMCDCNLAGIHNRGFEVATTGEWRFTVSAAEIPSHAFIQQHGCKHSMPPTRFKALRAYIADGRIFDFESGAYLTEAA